MEPSTFALDADFPGGNIAVDHVEDNTVYLYQELRDTEVWWFYWYFRVRNAAGRRLVFQFTLDDVFGPLGPALSTDGGKSWTWLGRAAVQGTSFAYTFPADQDEVRFAFAPPYVESDLKRFLDQREGNPALHLDTLCRTRKGRAVELLRLGRLDKESPHRVMLTCRHHACESIASYVLEGLMAAVLDEGPSDGAFGPWLREHVAFLIVPFVDKDGVEEGDQGKQRRPRDHNRDYEGTSIYAVPRTLRALIPTWSRDRLHVALDLHCPYIRGDHSEVIYCVGDQNAANWSQVEAFSAILESTRQGPLIYRAQDNLPFGVGWNTVDNMAQGKSFSTWVAEPPEVRAATTIETPYARVYGEPVTPGAARAFGRDLARALYYYLKG